MSDSINDKWLALPKRFRIAVVYSAMIAFPFIVLNIITTSFPWCIYPIFGLMWWPLSTYFLDRHQPLLYAFWGAGLLSALFVLTYLFTGFGGYPWFLFPVLAVGWWPMGVWGAHAGARRFSITGALYLLLMLYIFNLITSPGFLWCLFPAVGILWWPVGVHLHYHNHKDGEEE